MKWIVIGVICLVVVLLWALGKFVERTFAYRPPSPPTPSPPASTGSATATATAPPTPPTPAPAPTVRVRSYGWGWPVTIGILVAIFLIWGLPALRTTAPVPQATAPKSQPYKPPPISLDLIEDKSIGVSVQQKDFHGKAQEMTIQSGGRALFFVDMFQLPQNGTVYLRAYVTRSFAGDMVLIVNGTKFTSLHKGGGKQWTVFRLPISVFHGGTNSIVLSSPGEEMIVLSPNIEIEGG
jgi:hypothetical protein